MKRNIKKTLLGVLFVLTAISVMAQPGPGDSGLNGGEGAGPVGGGAPLGGGLLILVSLTLGYTLRRVYELRKNSKIME